MMLLRRISSSVILFAVISHYFIGIQVLFAFIPVYLIYKYFTRYELKAKVVLITGASSGLGEALSHELYKQGCKVILAARRLDQLERVKSDLHAISCQNKTYEPDIVQLDITNYDSIPGTVDKILKRHRHIDILINNAGVGFKGLVAESDVTCYQKLMNVNFFGHVCLTNSFLPSMLSQNEGQIVMMNSVLGKISIPHRSAYNSSKHALQAYTDSLRAEISSSKLNVLSINPGYVKTPITSSTMTSTGKPFTEPDDSVQNGYDAEYVAKISVDAIINYEKEVAIAPLMPKLAVLIRNLWPNLYFILMARRAQHNLY